MIEQSKPKESGLVKIPRHVAIIMDGNGRWAAARNLSRTEGHRAGVENLRPVLQACVEEGIAYLTVYAFSTENWNRPREEVNGLLNILAEAIRTETPELHRNGVQVRHVGRTAELSEDLVRSIAEAVELTRYNNRIVLNVAFNYGGRAEIVDALRSILAAGVKPEAVTEQMVADHLYTAGQPDPDLVIRTGGEMRLSNFLIWQAAYAEYYSTPTYWPDFGREELRKALLAYQQRERRFGRVIEASNQLARSSREQGGDDAKGHL